MFILVHLNKLILKEIKQNILRQCIMIYLNFVLLVKPHYQKRSAKQQGMWPEYINTNLLYLHYSHILLNTPSVAVAFLQMAS